MGRYKCKGIRGNWVEDDMKRAISAIKRGVMKVYTAARKFNVPRRTLRRYLAENKDSKSTLGRKPLLNSDQEKDLKSRIIRLCNVGYPLTQRVLRSCVKTFCDENNIPTSSRGVMIGRDWLRGFLRRNPNISRRKAQNLNPARAQKLNKAVVSDYFSKLKKTMEDNDIMNKAERIFNIDEKSGCQLNLHNSPQVLAERGTKRVHIVGPEHGESVTVVSCGNALGHAIPPMILYKGKRMKPEWVDSLPTGAVAQMTPKGSMTTEAFVNWIHHFSKFKLPGKVLLIFDGAKCHLDYSIVETAEKYEIKLFCLPSNTTHELQPMDKSVFRSFEYYWDEEVLKYWSLHEDRKITKQRFGSLFSKVWDKAATPANIKSGFEATGIFPFNPDRIPEEAYAPSIPTYNPVPPASTSADNQDTDASDVSESLMNEGTSNIREDSIQPSVQQVTVEKDNSCIFSASTEQTSSNNTVHDDRRLLIQCPALNTMNDLLPFHCPSSSNRIENNLPSTQQPADDSDISVQRPALLAQQPLPADSAGSPFDSVNKDLMPSRFPSPNNGIENNLPSTQQPTDDSDISVQRPALLAQQPLPADSAGSPFDSVNKDLMPSRFPSPNNGIENNLPSTQQPTDDSDISVKRPDLLAQQPLPADSAGSPFDSVNKDLMPSPFPSSSSGIENNLPSTQPPADDSDNAVPHPSLLAQQPLPADSVVIENNTTDYCSDDDVPLSVISQKEIENLAETSSQSTSVVNKSKKSFYDMLKTPEKNTNPVVTTIRKKAINSLAQELTKSMFLDKKNVPGPSSSLPKGPQKRKQNLQKNQKKAVNKQRKTSEKLKKEVGTESWFCFVCQEDRVADMRPCGICATYVHEECVGLTVEDKDEFICTKCSKD